MKLLRGQGNDTLWLLIGVLLLLGIMASFSPGSTFGRAFISVRKSFEMIAGEGVGYCPFINPYALEIFSAGELEISGEHPLCDPIEYAYCYGNGHKVEGGKCKGEGPILDNDVTNGECDEGDRFAVSVFLTDEIKRDVGAVEPASGSCFIKPNDGSWVYVEKCFDYLKNYEMTFGEELPSSNKVAISLLMEKRPKWQCFLVFGLLPFLILYHLLNDILAFAFLRTNTRRLIAVFASLLAVLTGGLANIIVAISSFVGLSTGTAFLMTVFLLALVSIILGQLTATMGVVQSTTEAVQKVVTGTLMLRGVAEAARERQQNR